MTGQAPPTFDDLRELLLRAGPEVDLESVDTAWSIADRAHRGERRYSGDAYITHPLEVALLAAQWGESLSTVCAALLHDVPVPRLEADRGQIGDEVLQMVVELAALDGDPYLAMSALNDRRDVEPGLVRQVITLKLADRLHNSRTWRFVPADRAALKARENLEILVPLAAQFGLGAVGVELADLARATLTRRSHPGEPDDRPALERAPISDATSPRTGLSEGLLRRALLALPFEERHRYASEWTADLECSPPGRQRLAFAAGLLYSAILLRRDHRRRLIFPRPSN